MSSFKRVLDVGTVIVLVLAVAMFARVIAGNTRGGSPGSNGGANGAMVARISDTAFARLSREGHRIGSPSAKVTLVIFSSYLCGYCAEFEVTFEALVRERPADLAVVMKHFANTGTRRELLAHMAAECAAAQGKFEQYNHVAFHTPGLRLRREPWRAIADTIAIPDKGRFAECVQSNEYQAEIARDTDDGQRLGVDGTPTSFLNGHRLIGAITVASLDSLLTSQLAALDGPK